MELRPLCSRCGAKLAPTLSGLRCPRLSACGKGGIVETLDFQPALELLARSSGAAA